MLLRHSNLLDNAVKYAPDADTVRVTTERIDGRLAIRVRDDGPGIPTDEQEQIFKKFVRGANAQASSAKGTGLGLTMVRHIAQHHGGDVDLESEPGQGSTFTLFLPMAE